MSDSASSLCFGHMKRRYHEFTILCMFDSVGAANSHSKVEFKVNGVKQNYAMKLGEGGEAFFVFETTDEIPASLQTSPLVSPTTSPKMRSEENLSSSLPEPEYLDLDQSKAAVRPPLVSRGARAASDLGMMIVSY
jgi:phosphatidate phosphatase LPIN